MPLHALDHGVQRTLAFGIAALVELVLHTAAQQGVYQETAAARKRARRTAPAAFEYALQFVGIDEIVDTSVNLGQHLAVGLDIGRGAVVHDQPLRRVVADELRLVDPAGHFAFLDVPENLLLHGGQLAPFGGLRFGCGRTLRSSCGRSAARRAEFGAGQQRSIALSAHAAGRLRGDGRSAGRAEFRPLKEF